MDIHTNQTYSWTGYDVTAYFQSEVIAKNRLKCRLRWLQMDFLKNF